MYIVFLEQLSEISLCITYPCGQDIGSRIKKSRNHRRAVKSQDRSRPQVSPFEWPVGLEGNKGKGEAKTEVKGREARIKYVPHAHTMHKTNPQPIEEMRIKYLKPSTSTLKIENDPKNDHARLWSYALERKPRRPMPNTPLHTSRETR